MPYKYNVDIFFDLRYLVPGKILFVISKGILNELNYLSKKKGKSGLEARFALKLLDKNKENILIEDNSEAVDYWIRNYAKENRAIVCTDDILLKSRLKKDHIGVVGLKSKSQVAYE